MKLEITLCYSVIEFCLANLNQLIRDNPATQVLDEIQRRKIILHTDLEECWRDYFEAKHPELLMLYEQFISDTVLYADKCELLDHYSVSQNADQLFKADESYKKLLYNISQSSKDKILFTDMIDDLIKSPLSEVDIYNTTRILDHTEENPLNSYRLPIVNKQIPFGDHSSTLCNWMKKFWEGDSEVIICDNYIYANHQHLLDYFLQHYTNGSKIKLYTLIPRGKTDQDVIDLFINPPFDQWVFELNILNDRKEHHSREIVTSKYLIQLDKGFAVFGRNGQTDQSVIHVDYLRHPFPLPPARKIL